VGTTIKLAETADELEQVFRGRHRIYVEECGYAPCSGDGLLRDAFDGLACTANGIVVRDGLVLAGARMVVAAGPLPTDSRFDFRPHLPRRDAPLAAGGFFFVEPALRGARSVLELLRLLLAWARASGAHHAVAVAAPRARRLLEAVGFELAAPPYVEAETGLPCLPLRNDLSRTPASPRPSRPRREVRA
jgi:N-acyl-L-homoserine lactone synthetase